MTPSSQLILNEARPAPGDRVLLLSAGDPELVAAIGTRAAEIHVYDRSWGGLRRARERIAAALEITLKTTFSDAVFPAPGGGFDAALMAVPKARDFARAQLWSALRALRPGGRLYVAGPNDGGAKTILSDAAALFGNGATLATKQRCRVGVSVRPEVEPSYPVAWGDDSTVPRPIALETPLGAFTVATMPGVFSWQGLDSGTAFLLEHLEVEPDATVLDVGCGYGILGLAAARQARSVTMIDDDLLAVRCARESASLARASNVEVRPGDVYDGLEGRRFGLIVSNPPFHKEFDVDTGVALRVVREAGASLDPGGRLVIVANAFLPYESAMAQSFARTRVIARNRRYAVMEGVLAKR